MKLRLSFDGTPRSAAPAVLGLIVLTMLATGPLLPTSAWAGEAEDARLEELDRRAEEEARREASWRKRHEEALKAVDEARKEWEKAAEDRRRMGHRKKWHERRRSEVNQSLEDARLALAREEQALEEFYEEAHRAGIPPGWVRPPEGGVSAGLATDEEPRR